MQTFILDTAGWDLMIDAGGDIAVASDPYSQAQDAASAIKTYQGECYYDVNLGIPYWASVLGKTPSLALMKSYSTMAALTVPGTVTAVAYINSFVNRKVTGQVQISNIAGQISVAGFGPSIASAASTPLIPGPPPIPPTDQSLPTIAIEGGP